jgi:DNA-binding response OmpR family regulator
MSSRPAGTVLIVEDEPDIRALILREVEQMGLRPLPCASARDALREPERFDLALIDVLLPAGSGVTVAHELRRRELTARLPIIFVTIVDQVAGIQDLDPPAMILHKPFPRAELRRVIAEALGSTGEAGANHPG